MDAPAFVPGDALPGAPDLAGRGPRPVGVTTLPLANPYQIDVLGSLAAGEPVRATRHLSAEVWYPALCDGRALYTDHLEGPDGERPGSPRTIRFAGRAERDADPDRSAGPAPLVVVSHGHPGSPLRHSWLGENLASKGYAVLALSHTDGTHEDRGDPLSRLRNRPLDVALALRVAADLERAHPLLHHVWDADRVALVGHAMGGYGVLVALGAGLDVGAFEPLGITDPLRHELVDDLAAGMPFHEDLVDAVTSRVRAGVLLAPWGGDAAWSRHALARVSTPLFLAAGSEDDGAAVRTGLAAGYAGVRTLFEASVASDRWLLTFDGARHGVGSNPPPEALASASPDAWWRYADPVWDVRRITSVLQHHVTAFLDTHLRGLPRDAYLSGAAAAPRGSDWPGYPPRSTVGLRMEHRAASPVAEHPGEDVHGVRDLSAAVWAGLSQAWRAHRSRSSRPTGV